MGKAIAVDHLNDTTAFPWFLNFSKNFSADYRKCKSNRWDYLISIHNFENSNPYDTSVESDPVYKRFSLIDKYNERLFFYSKDKANPWIIDDRDEDCVVLHKKNYFEFENKLAFIIDEEIEKKIASNTLTEKYIQLEKKRLSQLAKLALLKTVIEECLEETSSAISCLDSQVAIDQFRSLMAQEMDSTSIQSEIKKIKKQQEKLNKELHVHFLKKTETVRIYSIISIWEKIIKFVSKNKPMQFFTVLWYGLSSHANLLSWISFLLLFFSFSLYSFPIIFLVLGISLTSYLILRFFYLVKKDSVIFPNLATTEAEEILKVLKIEIFNEEKSKNEFKLIQEIVFDLSKKKLNINEFLNSISSIQRNLYSVHLSSLNIQESKLYRYLAEVYPKTQFIASLTINLTSIVLYTYLLTWAIHSVFLFIGMLSLATLSASPLAIGILILIAATFFLANHLCEFRVREDFYERTFLNRINEKCEYYFKDNNGKQQIIQIEKWKKFEYLQDNIEFLECEFKIFFEKNKLDNLDKKFYSLFDSYVLKKNVYTSYDQDKVSGDSTAGFRKFKKFLNRSFAFFGGSFYGYNLTQQIVWKSNLGIHTLVKTLTLPLVLIFIPLMIINGIANFITYHLHSRQRSRFEMVKNLDSRIEVLEQTNKKLLFLATLLSLELKHSSDQTVHLNTHPEAHADLLLSTKSVSFKQTDHFSFFKKNHQEIKSNEKNEISSSMINISKT
ncbi:hypothetical protein [Rickettsiella endosymbiont of Rhagonycha lignosa]|uniref:hypothetical protein n=1 Tax=Rickettsiella endosymbiont of Rhagonycha lignosa TaxID=3077937 RepID=UPI00313C4BFD